MRFRFSPDAAAALPALRVSVRAFLDAERGAGRFSPRPNCWNHYDAGFTRRAAEHGFVGLTLPPAYGGRGGTALERYAVCEEMLAAGAPVGMHWIADRQSGPQILRHGSDAARQRILPQIAAGRCCIGIGMSEPGAGSDLAAVRTRAVRVPGGWRVTGSKLWTTQGHRADYIIALVRTGEPVPQKHAGLTQLVIDMRSPGVSTHPIPDMTGCTDFNEVVLDDVYVADDFVLGSPGIGWQLVTGELAWERSGPERFMSTFPVLQALAGRVQARDPQACAALGRLVTHFLALRTMSNAVAGLLQAGRTPDVEAALVKDIGTAFEREVLEVARQCVADRPEPGSDGPYRRVLADALLASPSFTLRGGTREILRGIVAKQLTGTKRHDLAGDHAANPVEELALQLMPAAGRPSADPLDAALWSSFRSTGLDQVLCSGETHALADAALVLRAAGRSAARIPAAEAVLGQWLARQAGWEPIPGLSTVLTAADSWDSVPWGRMAGVVYALEDGVIVRYHGPFHVRREGCNIAGEPRDALTRPTAKPERSGAALGEQQLLARSALLKAAMMAGAMDQLLEICVTHALEREQFGQRIAQFQAVQQMLSLLAAHGAAAGAAVDLAASEGSLLTAATAKARTSEAALPVTDAAHQITGAMGFTIEFPLQQLTRRLWAWRDESGTEQFWHRHLGDAAARQGEQGLWPLLSSPEALRRAAD